MGIDRKRYLTIKEASAKSGYNYEHIRKLVKAGTVAILPIDDRKYLIDWESLQVYMQGRANRGPHRK